MAKKKVPATDTATVSVAGAVYQPVVAQAQPQTEPTPEPILPVDAAQGDAPPVVEPVAEPTATQEPVLAPEPAVTNIAVNFDGNVKGAVVVPSGTTLKGALDELKVLGPEQYQFRDSKGKPIALDIALTTDLAVKAEVKVTAVPKTRQG